MALTQSYQNYATVPSAVLSDGGLLNVPLWAVTAMGLTETYHLPAIGSTGAKAVVGTHNDSITMSAVLVGAERMAWKVALETLAEVGARGSALAGYTGAAAGGLILVAALTVRTDLYIKSLQFNVGTAKRDTIDVSLSLDHLPRPTGLGKLIDTVGSVAVGLLNDGLGN
jgi:phage protein U